MTDLHNAAQQALEALELGRIISVSDSGTKEVTPKLITDAITALREALAKPAVPPGYALVPVEPTPEMVRAYRSKHVGGGFNDEAYRAMLAARPEALK